MKYLSLIMIVSVSCWYFYLLSQEDFSSVPSQHIDLKKVENKLEIHFPEATKITFSHTESGIDTITHLIVVFDAKYLDGFIDSSPLNKEKFSQNNQSYLGINFSEWKPDTYDPALKVAQSSVAKNILNIGYSETDAAGKVHVFIMWHTL